MRRTNAKSIAKERENLIWIGLKTFIPMAGIALLLRMLLA